MRHGGKTEGKQDRNDTFKATYCQEPAMFRRERRREVALWCIASASFLKIAMVLLSPPTVSLRHRLHIMGFLHTLFIFLPGVSAEWSDNILFFLFSTAIKTRLCAFKTIGVQLSNDCTTPWSLFFLYINLKMDGEKEHSNQ